jgi:Uma2 family endonuclease
MMSTTVAPAPVAPSAPPPALGPDEPIFRLSVEQYQAMVRAGILAADDPVELLEGYLIQKMAKNPPHRLAKRKLYRALVTLLPTGWDIDTQDAITTDDSEPEPDVFVFRAVPDDYADRHPGPQDLALVTEIADSSLRRDRGRKKRIYARAAVPVYWIVNLVDRQIEVYTDPTGPADEPTYRHRQDYLADAQVPVVVGGAEVGRLTVADLLP